jgi:hypothetical protein
MSHDDIPGYKFWRMIKIFSVVAVLVLIVVGAIFGQ